MRTVSCPACGHRIDASLKAMSLRCPRCTQPLVLEDVTLAEPTEGRLDTVGHVSITTASAMTGQVVCGQLTSAGQFDGTAVVHGKIELAASSRTTGHLRGQSLTVLLGATMTGHATIRPNTADASAKAVTAEPEPSKTRRRRSRQSD